jgi:O-antigen/teichoic acid export membrane protein
VFRYFYNSLLAKLFATTCSVVTGIVSLKLFDLYLTPREFGILAVCLQILAYLPFLDGGVRTAANYRVLSSSSDAEKTRLLVFCQKFYSWFGLGILAATIIAMSAYWLTPNIRSSGEPIAFFLVLGLVLALASMAIAQGGVLIALGAQDYTFWVQGISGLLNLGMLALGLQWGFNVWAFPFANAAALLFSWPMFVIAIRSKVPGFKILDLRVTDEFKAEFKSLRNLAFHSFRTQLSIVLLFSVDLVIVGVVYPPREAAVYALFTRIFGIVRSLIQSAGEVSWPLWAQNRAGGKDWSHLLLKANAWIYGSVVGAMAFSLIPFLRWFMGPEWTGSQPLFAIMLVRFLVTGISNPAGYFLIGRGEYRSLAKVLELEVVVAVVLAILLRTRGPEGIAAAFLMATTCGTMWPILWQYGAISEHRRLPLIGGVWLRAAAAFGGSVVVTAWLVQMASSQLVIVGAALGTCTGLTIGLLFSYVHWRWRNEESTAPVFSFRAMVSKI